LNQLDKYLHFEQHVNPGSPSGFSAVHRPPPECDPLLVRSFQLPLIQVPLSNRLQVGALPESVPLSEDVVAVYPTDRRSLECGVLAGEVTCYPTASGRTVVVVGAEGDKRLWHIKLSYPGVLGRVDRELPWLKAVAGVENTRDLQKHPEGGSLAFLPELACRGVWTGSHTTCYVLRDHVPWPRGSGGELVPWFSLLAGGPLGAGAFEAVFGEADLERAWGVLEALLRGYFSWVFEIGVMPEMNAQNLLVESGSEGELRLVARDLGRAERLLHVRRRAGLSTPQLSPTYKVIDADADPTTARTRHSFSFDFKLSKYVIEPFIVALEAHVEQATKLSKWVRELTRDLIAADPDAARWFPSPKTSYGHDKVMLTAERTYVDFGASLYR
jgi:hypothetical protein